MCACRNHVRLCKESILLNPKLVHRIKERRLELTQIERYTRLVTQTNRHPTRGENNHPFGTDTNWGRRILI